MKLYPKKCETQDRIQTNQQGLLSKRLFCEIVSKAFQHVIKHTCLAVPLRYDISVEVNHGNVFELTQEIFK